MGRQHGGVNPTFDAVLCYIADHTGMVTSTELSNHFPVESRTFGRQRFTSQLICRFRKAGFIADVADRCACCGAAKTRGQQNTFLRITDAGLAYLRQNRRSDIRHQP